MSGASLLQPEERVLSTLNKDGSRRWLTPKLSTGRYWRRRRIVAWLLIAVFVSLPWITIGGKPAVLLDIGRREFTLLGRTFLPTDTLLLMLLVVGTFLTVFFLTALLGRVWCGWACPQTVYMEFVYRPIERWASRIAKGESRSSPWRKGVKIALYFVISFFIAHTFLSYFVGVDQLRQWIFESPAKHPAGFATVVLVTGLMLLDFGLLREQVCLIMCPYGRFQSVMLDRNSLIVSYDPGRGEPRGKLGAKAARGAAAGTGDLHLKVVGEGGVATLPAGGEARRGDCVDCHLCVTTCPTGIDIRNGLQMECINCTQCIDACDAVMTKLGRPTGLIRYSSQNAIDGGRSRVLRPRVVIYPAILLVIFSVFVWRLGTMQPAYVSVLRGKGMPYNQLPDGRIGNSLKVRVVNRSPEARDYRVELVSPAGGQIVGGGEFTGVAPGKLAESGIVVALPPEAFVAGRVDAMLRVTDGGELKIEKSVHLLGPHGGRVAPAAPDGGAR